MLGVDNSVAQPHHLWRHRARAGPRADRPLEGVSHDSALPRFDLPPARLRLRPQGASDRRRDAAFARLARTRTAALADLRTWRGRRAARAATGRPVRRRRTCLASAALGAPAELTARLARAPSRLPIPASLARPSGGPLRPALPRLSPRPTARLYRAARQGADMDHFLYRDGELRAEDVPSRDIAAAVGTPVYCLFLRHPAPALAAVRRRRSRASPTWSASPSRRNSNLAVLKLLGDQGAGMDVVSEGEYRRAHAAGVPGERIVFSGVGKTRAEMRAALKGGIRQFNVESEPEMRALSEVADGARRDRADRASASTRTWMPEPTPRSPPARARTSSASPSPAPAQVYAEAARAARPAGRRHRRPYRQPAHRPRALRGGLSRRSPT